MRPNGKAQKDTGTKTLVVKSLWIIFIIFMIILLLYSMINIIKAKQDYQSTNQSSSTFPAITICPYQPFSNRAIDYFEKGGMSPKAFSQKLRHMAMKHLDNNEPSKAESMIFYDDLRIYYQNLPYKDAINIALNQSEIFVFCRTKLRNGILSGKADSNCGYNISRYSTPDFFNCYTINIQPKYSRVTEFIHLIIQFPKPESLNKYMDKALLNSLSQNVIGAQLLVHESNSYPLSSAEKIHIEPNKLLQINYLNTLSGSCKSDQSENMVDLENQYRSLFAECMSSFNGKKILTECGCVVALLPRSIIPSLEFPYCANFQNLTEQGFGNFKNRSKCIRSVLSSLDKMSSSEKNCSKRCELKKFILHISNINWEPNLWQLEWLSKLQESWNILIDEPQGDPRNENAKNLVTQFLKSTDSRNQRSSYNDIYTSPQNGKYAYIVLEKSTKDPFDNDQNLISEFCGLGGKMLVSIIPHIVLLCVFIIEVVRSFAVIWNGKPRQISEVELKENKEDYLSRPELE